MERASDRKSCFHCTWNRDAVWKISEDHDSADLFRLGAGVRRSCRYRILYYYEAGASKDRKKRRQRRKILVQTVQML